MELREGGIDHLGQVRKAYLEANGSVSLFYYEDEQVKFGLPELFARKSVQIKKTDTYTCRFCGYVEKLTPQPAPYPCPRCQHKEWVSAQQNRRVT